jgi:hypothetical protein
MRLIVHAKTIAAFLSDSQRLLLQKTVEQKPLK